MSNQDEAVLVNLPEGISFQADELMQQSLSLLSVRDEIMNALEAKGFKRVGSGFGMGEADLDMEFQGRVFNICLKERHRRPSTAVVN